MSVAMVAPGVPLSLGSGRVALWRPLRSSIVVPSSNDSGPTPADVPGLSGWWDAGSLGGMLDSLGNPVPSWGNPVSRVFDRSGHGGTLAPWSFASGTGLPLATPRLSGLLGGLGRVASGADALAPALDPDIGFRVVGPSLGSGADWTRYLVWSRPNLRQNSGHDASPITLLSVGATPVLQIDSQSAQSRLVLCPGIGQTVLSTGIARRHTHSIVLRSQA